jgi:hypothetical protein
MPNKSPLVIRKIWLSQVSDDESTVILTLWKAAERQSKPLLIQKSSDSEQQTNSTTFAIQYPELLI